jgi:hypothetical protein
MTDLPATPADGNVSVKIVAAVADMDAPATTEIDAVTSVDASCYLTSDGFTPGLDEQVVADERLCSTQVFEQPGRHTRTLDVIYIDNSNTADPNEVKETLVPGSEHVIAVRRGIAFDTASANGQQVWLTPVKAGQYNDLPPEANSVLKTGQKLFVTGASVLATVGGDSSSSS